MLGTRGKPVNQVNLSGARTLLGAPGHTTRSKKLLVTKGIATRSKDAIRGKSTVRLKRRNKTSAPEDSQLSCITRGTRASLLVARSY